MEAIGEIHIDDGAMGKVVAVTSGKGGVGKTTSTAALGAALASAGQKVAVVDFDIGLRNLDLIMGAERSVVFDLINVVEGGAKLRQALIRDPRLDTLYLLPASQTRDKDALTEEGVQDIITELRTTFDWVICDSPAGIERGAVLAMRFADEAIVVTNPEISSVRDSDRIIGYLDTKTMKAENGEHILKHLLIARFDPVRVSCQEMLGVEDVLDILAIPLLGVIPESEEVMRASNLGSLITGRDPKSALSQAYFDAARRLAGESVKMTMPGGKKGLFSKLFGPEIVLEQGRRQIRHAKLTTVPDEEVFNGGKTMDAVKPDKSAPATAAKVVESERRDLARPKAPSTVDGGGLSGDVLQAGAKSITEIEKLMGELHAARDYLQSEGERLRRDTARYAHLTQSALSSVKMISESMEKWRETDLPAPG
jgi:septum site-determining protein MinD